MYEFKQRFIDRYSKLTDFEAFKEYSLKELKRCIRVNTLKQPIEKVHDSIQKKGWQLTPVPWCREGFWIYNSERKDVGNLLEHSLGYIYIQEAASMIPPIVLNPQEHDLVLDMAASPGSKTTQMAQYMNNTGAILANDYQGIRLAPLGMNLQRMGIWNTAVTLGYGQRFRNYQFDRILLDAPCSGTGTIRKSLKTIRMWNPLMIRRLAHQQKQLILTAFQNLKPGGTLVYSTCSVEPEEDEAVVHHLLTTYKDAYVDVIAEKELPGLKRSPPVTEFEQEQYDPQVRNCLRIWPQDNDTEGFFVCRIRKKE